jgi:hypothetical protein
MSGGELALRRGLLLAIAAAAAGAVWGGLARLGLALPGGGRLAGAHGALFVLGVFGSVVALERAVALGARWAYAAPALGVTAALALLAGAGGLAPGLALGSALGLAAINVALLARRADAATGLMLVGALLLVAGNAAHALGVAKTDLLPAWIAFFALTIAAERLELSRLAPTPAWAERLLVAFAGGLVLAVALALAGRGTAVRGAGLLLSLLGLWQLRFDLARRTLRAPGLPRFAATGVLAGAAWLVVGGLLLARSGLPPAGPHLDAALHALFVGFVLSMVFAHAPIILPAVARIELPFHPLLYLPLALLHLGLVARVAGDLAGDGPLRRAGGIANAAALALFFAAALAARALRGGRSGGGGAPAVLREPASSRPASAE